MANQDVVIGKTVEVGGRTFTRFEKGAALPLPIQPTAPEFDSEYRVVCESCGSLIDYYGWHNNGFYGYCVHCENVCGPLMVKATVVKMTEDQLREVKHSKGHRLLYSKIDSACKDLHGSAFELEMETRSYLSDWREWDEAYKLPLHASADRLEQAYTLVEAARTLFQLFLTDLREKSQTELNRLLTQGE